MRAALVALLVAVLPAACGNAPLSSPLVSAPAGGAGGASSGAAGVTGSAGGSSVSTGGSGGTVTPGVGTPRVEAFTGPFDTPRGIAVEDASTAWVTDMTRSLVRLDLTTHEASAPRWSAPVEMTVFPPSGVLIWKGTIYTTQGCSFQKFIPATATVDFLMGGGPGGCGGMNVAPGLYGLATDGTTLYWNYPDFINMAILSHEMWSIEMSFSYKVVAGDFDYVSGAGAQDGVGPAAKMNAPRGLALDGAGGLFFADELNHAIRRVDLSNGETRTFAGALREPGAQDGPLAAARFDKPEGLAFDGRDSLYVADHDNGLVRVVSLAAGTVSTVAGVAGNFAVAAGQTPAPIGHPTGLALTPAGDVLVSSDSEGAVLIVHLP